MNNDVIDWLKLYFSVSSGVKLCRLYAHFGSPGAILSASYGELMMSRCADEKTTAAILSADEKQAEDTALICEKYGWSVVTPESGYYPVGLKHINDFPCVLFCSGDTELLRREPKISVVGTRSPSDKGLMAAYLLGCCLSSLGVVTVSGGAVGIDAASHEGALTGNGGTIAVLGCGLGAEYLPQNSFMRKRIEKNGLLISEFPPFSAPTRFSFPKRNRIIAALSDAVVVAESGTKGGSLITAEYAEKQGKNVFCFRGEAVSSPGCEELVRNGASEFSTPRELLSCCKTQPPYLREHEKYLDMGFENDGIHGVHIIKPSTMTADSFAAYNGITPELARRVLGSRLKSVGAAPGKKEARQSPESGENEVRQTKEKKSSAKRKKSEKKESEKKAEGKTESRNIQPAAVPDYLSEEAKRVFEALGEEPRYQDEIQCLASLSVQDIMTAITELELEGLAVLHPGGRVSRA